MWKPFCLSVLPSIIVCCPTTQRWLFFVGKLNVHHIQRNCRTGIIKFCLGWRKKRQNYLLSSFLIEWLNGWCVPQGKFPFLNKTDNLSQLFSLSDIDSIYRKPTLNRVKFLRCRGTPSETMVANYILRKWRIVLGYVKQDTSILCF